jgi:hypothetical protein
LFDAARMASDIDISSYNGTNVNNKGANIEIINEILSEEDMPQEILRMVFLSLYK